MATTGMQGGFATASGKAVSVSEAALQRARVLWDEANRDEPEPFCEDGGRNIGFATGSGKKVDVSAGALERAQRLWREEKEKLSPSEECLFDEETNEDMSKCDAIVTDGLEDAMLKDKYLEEEFAKDLTPDEEDVPFCGLSEGIPDISMATAGFNGGFSTASGKSVSVSAAALERAQGLWKEECDKDSTISYINSSPEDIGAKIKPAGFSAGVGFSTASGKSVKVSVAALEKAKQLWKEDSEKEASLEGLEDYDFPESPPEDNSIPPKNVPGSSFSGGFATASGKGVSVSAAAMERAQGLWREESEKEEEQEEESLDRSESSDIRREDKEVLRKEAPGPSFTSTPVALSSSVNKGEKPRGFITPFRKHTNVLTPLQQKVSPLVVGSTNNPPAPNLSRSVSLRKTLGARLNNRQFTPSTSTVLRESQSLREPLKRGRCPSDESHPLNKTPKISNSLMSTSSTSSHSFTSTCTTLDSNTSLNSSTKSSYNISISESQEILESSKALLEDCDQEMMTEGPDCTSGSLPDGPVAFHLFLHDGKPVSHILAMVLRVYPLTFACKSLDKKIDFYSEASYEKLKVMREQKEHEEMEKIYSQVEAEMKKTKQQQTRRLPLSCLNKDNLERMPVEELLGIAAGGDDFCDIQFLLSSSKLQQLQEAREKEREATARAVKVEVEKRLKTLTFGFSSVTPVLKIRLMDMTHESSTASRRYAVLSFWGPNEDLCASFVEGSVYDISSISSSHSRPDELRLNSMRGTQVQVRTHPLAADQFQLFSRKCFTVGEVVDDEFSPAFNEFDLVGLVVSVDDDNSSGVSGQVVYLADEAVNILGLKLWKSVRDEGLEKFLTVGNFVGVSNAQWRQSSRNHSVPWGFVQETTKFCSRPKESRIGSCLEHLRSSITDVAHYVSECEGKIQAILSGSSVETPKTPPLVRRIQRHNTEDLPHKRLEFLDN